MKKYFLILLLLFLYCSERAYPQTSYYGGVINSDTTWSNDTVKITGNVTVNYNVTLTIQAGTYIEFQNHYTIDVKGRLLANGNATDSITFTILDTTGFGIFTDTAGGWNGIHFIVSVIDTSVISYCNLLYLKGTAIQIDNPFTKVKINHSKIAHVNYSRSIYCYKSTPIIEYNSFYDIGGKGIECVEASPVISNNFISYCGTHNGSYGTGIYCNNNSNSIIKANNISYCSFSGIMAVGSSPLITENIISNNYSFYGGFNEPGGGIYCLYSSATIMKNTICSNTASGGGGIACINSPLYIALNKICNNNSNTIGCGYKDGGGGVFVLSSSPKIINNIICNNSSLGEGGGIFLFINDTITNDTILIVNNTIANNDANRGGGIVTRYRSNPKIVNTIIWGNTATIDGDQVLIFNNTTSFLNCDVDSVDMYSGLDTIINSIKTNPEFVNPSAGTGLSYDGLSADWSIQPSSPCVNAGNPDTTGLYLCSKDIAGSIRLLDDTIDIGAYEYTLYVSVPEIENPSETGMLVFPNPTSGKLTIQTKSLTAQSYVLSVKNIQGQVLFTEKTIIDKTLALDLSKFSNGIYFLCLQNEKENYVSKVVVQR